MLVVHVHVRVRPERVEDFLAATVVNARASLVALPGLAGCGGGDDGGAARIRSVLRGVPGG
jgi:hypothetical protein